MFEIISKQILAEDIKRVDVFAPHIAKRVKPGQFVKVCPEEGDENIPLTVVDWDKQKETISLIFQEIGETTGKLGSLPINESIYSILGPLGVPSKVEKRGVVICVATGIGTAQILPICRAYGKEGNKIIGIIGAKTKRALMLEPQMRLACNRIQITTNDGSYERKGLATDILKEEIQKYEADKKDMRSLLVYAIGSGDMMQAVCDFTKKKNLKTLVQLSPVMVDCIGMCGSCRVKVDDKIVLACTDGPEFDGHKVDFDEFIKRSNAQKELDEWSNKKLPLRQKKKESKTLMRFLSDFLKSQQ